MRVFVGDIQGCLPELDALLRRAREACGPDFELWAVGDLVNRGPDSFGVLRRLRDLQSAGRARLVLGNHDVALIACGLGLRKPHKKDTIGDVLAAPDAQDWIAWLRSLPFALQGEIEGEAFAMVHAAVPAEFPLEELATRSAAISARLSAGEDDARELLGNTRMRAWDAEEDAPRDPDADLLDALTCTRSVGPDGRWSSAPPDEAEGREAWHAAWGRAGHAYHVVYGHWALQGLHVADGLRGLDTGCVHHRPETPGYLTGWLPDRPREASEGGPFAAPDSRFLRERAHAVYFQQRGNAKPADGRENA